LQRLDNSIYQILKGEIFMFNKNNFLRSPARLSRLTLLLLLIVVFAMGCREILEPEPPECEKNHTGTLSFHNRSSSATYDVILDGYSVGRIRPGESIEQKVAAGQHSVRFVFANTNRTACNTAYPSVPQCDEISLSCSAGF
jgi:hypothetical protein